MKMSAIIPIYKTGAKRPKLLSASWPRAPLLELPAGDLRNFGGGRILTADHFVLAAGLSQTHYIAVARAPGVGPIESVWDQAIGFLYAHGAAVVRTNLRAPVMWFTDEHLDFAWRKRLVFFARIFLSTDPTDSPWVPPMNWPVTRLARVASAGLQHWQMVNKVLEGVEAADSGLLSLMGRSLAAMARRWEFYRARMVVLCQRAGDYDAEDQELMGVCDRLLFSIMGRFDPGYELLPATTIRLL